MAKRGPNPLPENLRNLKGSAGGSPRGASPTTPPGRPERPDYLDDQAAAEWDRLVPKLEAIGVMAESYGPALALYCEAYSRWRQAEALVSKHGMIVPTARGGHQVHPAMRISRDASATMLRFLCEFGLTPASRRGVQAEAPREPDALDIFLATNPASRRPDAS
jgi:P27 family predicted phage terminase small subunit